MPGKILSQSMKDDSPITTCRDSNNLRIEKVSSPDKGSGARHAENQHVSVLSEFNLMNSCPEDVGNKYADGCSMAG